MKETLLFLATPISASIILAGMLGYFGTHILTRRIIFIDTAVAQVAALGTMIGLLLGYAEEAVIGIIYCLGLALALALLLAEKIPVGSNFITKTITGNILWVTWDKVIKLGLLFAAIGVIHLLLGKKFFDLSNQKNQKVPGLSLNERFPDLLFYITFGLVVVKAVLIGGIFLVFTLLIAPSVAASIIVKSWKGRLFWSWIIGLLGTVTGILISYWLNISNGPAIVCVLGILVFVMAFVKLSRPLHK